MILYRFTWHGGQSSSTLPRQVKNVLSTTEIERAHVFSHFIFSQFGFGDYAGHALISAFPEFASFGNDLGRMFCCLMAEAKEAQQEWSYS